MHTAGGIVMNQPDDSAVPIPAAGPAVTPAPQTPDSPPDRVPVLAWMIGAAFVAVELAVSGRYGLPAGRAVLHRGGAPSRVRLRGPAATGPAAHPDHGHPRRQPDGAPGHPGA